METHARREDSAQPHRRSRGHDTPAIATVREQRSSCPAPSVERAMANPAFGVGDDDVCMEEHISASGHDVTSTTIDGKGKPMRRFLHDVAVSPFEHARSRAQMQLTRAAYEPMDDVVYAKVQHVAWENDIVWGIDFSARNTLDCGQLAAIEEEVEEDVSRRGGGDCEVVETSGSLQPRPLDKHTGSSMHARLTESNTPALPQQRTSEHHHISVVETPWMPTFMDTEFDMTKPRHYRWEIPASTCDNSSRTGPTDKQMKNGVQTTTKLPCPLNKELHDGSWVDAIGWNWTQDMPESKLVIDDNDESLILVDVNELPSTIRVQVQAPASLTTKPSRTGTHAGDLHHSLPAIKLSMTKPELPKTKLREFHRPRSKFKINERMVFAPPPVVPVPPVEESAVVTQIKKSSDLNLTAGGKIILVEYTEQNPPMLSNPGMASRILHYWRPPDNDEDVLVGKKKVKKAKPKAPEMKMGQVITLGHHDETPFVGDVPPGRVVTSLNSKLYKVPIFQHKPVAPFAPSTSVRESGQYELFLLCRSVSKSKKGAAIGESAKTTMYAFEMPDLYLAGQVEPQIEVPAPNSEVAKKFIQPYMALHISRMFKHAGGDRLKIEDVERAFPTQSSTAIRKAMKSNASFERGGNDSGAWKRHRSLDLTEEEALIAKLSPESVCLHESMMAGQRRLLDIGLTKQFSTKGVEGAINRLLKRLEMRKRALSSVLIDPLQLSRRQKERVESDIWKRDPTIRKMELDIQVARYILHELQLTPWNLTSNYVECHLQGKGLLAVGGHGDPTGRGEGFSFVRAPQLRGKKPESPRESAVNVEKAVASVTGTTADLRKLKMREAGLVLRNLGVPESEIATLKRWERVQRLREISTTATARGEGGALSKFARGGRKSLSAQQQDYRRKCDVIYERQMDVLSATTVSFSDSEESDNDSDSIDDFEDELLGAVSVLKHTSQRAMDLVSHSLLVKETTGSNRFKEARAERDEAVELARLMRDMEDDSIVPSVSRRSDVDTNKLRKQLGASGIPASGPGSAAGSRGGSITASAISTPNEYRSLTSSPTSASNWPSSGEAPSRVPGRKVLKRTTRVVEEDGTETVRIEFVVDDRQVAQFQAKQHRQDRLQKTGHRDLIRKRGATGGASSSAKKMKRS